MKLRIVSILLSQRKLDSISTQINSLVTIKKYSEVLLQDFYFVRTGPACVWLKYS